VLTFTFYPTIVPLFDFHFLFLCSCVLVASPAFNECIQQKGPSSSTDTQSEKLDSGVSNELYMKSIGYGMTLASVLLSGFVTIYFEKVVKSKTEVISIWERNFQLCFFSIIFCVIMHFYTSATNITKSHDTTVTPNWSGLTLVVAILGAVNGLIVAATLKYADSILKVLAQAGAIIISTGLGYAFQNEPLDIFVVIGCLVSILSIMNYTFDSSLLPQSVQFSAIEKAGEGEEERGPLIRREGSKV
jgi:UDP-sugar transporter A1/2/3